MNPEPQPPGPPETDEQQLCPGCLPPNPVVGQASCLSGGAAKLALDSHPMDASPDRRDACPTTASALRFGGSKRELLVGRILTPNATTADFCAKCGAPLSSYATTAPFERLFAEGHVYRQAAERPHRPVILIGVWALFGTVGAVGAVLLFFSPRDGVMAALAGAVMLALSAMMLGRTTRNFVAHRRQARREAERE